MKTELLLMANKKKVEMLEIVLPYIRKNVLECGKIIVVTKGDCKPFIDKYENVEFRDEDTIFPGLNYSYLKMLMEDICGVGDRAGWYLQQFLKMAWSMNTESSNYIVWDIDTLPLHEITFIDKDQYLFTIKIEHHQPYFDTLKRLTGIKDTYKGSFIAEHMWIVSKYMRSLIDTIMENELLTGDTFFERILRSIAKEDLPACGFSEFETYGNFVMHKYPDAYRGRKLRTCRQGSLYLCKNPTKEMLDWAAKDYEIVSLEGNDRKFEPMVFLSKRRFVRSIFSMKDLVKARHKIRNIYGNVVGKKYLEFE